MFKTKGTALRNISKLKFSDKEFELFRNNKEVVLAAVKQDFNALLYASDKLKDDKEVVLEAVKQNGFSLVCVSDRLKDDVEVAMAVVKQDVLAFSCLSIRLKYDKYFVLSVLEQSDLDLYFVPDELKNDKEVVLAAVGKNYCAFKYASNELKNDKDILNAIRPTLMSDKWVQNIDEEVFAEAKVNLLRYDEQDRREKELLFKLAELNKLQAQQNSNQTKVEVRAKRKL